MSLYGPTYRAGQRRRFQLTALNRATNAAYRRCEKRGGHVKSGVILERIDQGVPHAYNVCARCSVPIKGGISVVGWAA